MEINHNVEWCIGIWHNIEHTAHGNVRSDPIDILLGNISILESKDNTSICLC